jgi:hypothetical protein
VAPLLIWVVVQDGSAQNLLPTVHLKLLIWLQPEGTTVTTAFRFGPSLSCLGFRVLG